MENLERFEGLSSTEIATLTSKRKGILIVLLVVSIGTPLLHLVFAILSGRWFYLLISFLIMAALIVLALRGLIRKLSALNADLQGGKKKILVNRIESQRQDIRQGGDSDNPHMEYTYLIRVNGRELEVSEAQYYQSKPGQLAEIELAPNSESVFSVSVLEDSAPGNNPQTVTAYYPPGERRTGPGNEQ